MELEGKHVVVTGSSRGIGAALARRFAAVGARVSLVARDQARLDAVAGEVSGRAFSCDLAEGDQVDGLIERIEGEAGPIDVLANNAGLATTAWLVDLDPDEIRSVARVNLEAPMVLTNRVLPGMIERGSGHLVYLSSLAGTAGFPGLATYGSTKAGIFNFVNALRLELKGTGIGTTVVAPGPIETEMWDQLEDEEGIAPTIRRFRRLQLIPQKSPEWLAAKAVEAVAEGRANVWTPRRLAANFWLTHAPARLNALVLRDVPTGPRAGP